MREIINPYHPDRIPENRRGFLGREELAVWLEQQLIARRRVFIFHGPSRIGKTSFLHYLPDMVTPGAIPLSFSLSEIKDLSLNKLFNYLLQRLTDQVVSKKLLDGDVARTASDSIQGINAVLADIHDRQPLADILFLVDDVDAIQNLPAEKVSTFFDACQSLLSSQAKLHFVFTAASASLLHLRHPILDSAPTRLISTLSGTDAQHLIANPVEGVMRFDYGVIKRIAELNSNHPYYINLFCQHLFNRYAREGWVNLRHLDDVLDIILTTEIPAFEAIWHQASRIERLVLVTMAGVKGAHGVFNQKEIIAPLTQQVKEADDQIILTALESLTFQGVLVKLGALSYRFYVDLFRFWLEKHFKFDAVLSDVVWKHPATRPEFEERLSPADLDNDRQDETQASGWAWPLWAKGLMGLTVAGVIGIGIVVLADAMGIRFVNPLASPPTPVVIATPTQTPTPPAVLPVLTPTPTSPLVVEKSLPSIAYMARKGDSPWQIQMMDLNGDVVTLLSDLVANDTTPVWSYQGDRLAFVSQRDDNREIYVTNIDGTELYNLSQNAADDWTPAWSPDGTKIAFASNREGFWEIYTINVDGTDLRRITKTGTGNISPVWSPDGQYISFASKRDGDWDIYSMRLDGTEIRRLTNNEVNDLAPVWSFSGKYIAYETNLDGDVEIYVMTSVGGNPRNVTSLPYADDHGPVWSPDDGRLVFYSNREGNWDLFAVNLDGSNATNLTQTPDIDEQTPAWRP